MASNPQASAALTEASPFSAVRISPELDGHAGTNRALGNRPQIAATTDIEAITAWLARFVDSPNTFGNYRKEAERLLLWSTLAVQKPLSSLNAWKSVVMGKIVSSRVDRGGRTIIKQ